MNLDQVAAELATALKTITGLRVPPWGVEKVSPPAALISLPERITYDETYQRGADKYEDVQVIVLVGRPNNRAARKAIAAYADGSGPKSVKAAVEAHAYTSCSEPHVAWCEFTDATYAGTSYLAAIFHCEITGKGA